ncbi:MAG: cell division protein FtsW [Oscillospiraceae bacterium]|nr:cell division protein FtsW [Oscillospiraceae bacterium]
MDLSFLLLVILLTLIGLLMLFSASYARANWEKDGDSAFYFRRQVYFAIFGFAGMLLAGRLNYFIWFRTALILLIASLGLLALVPLIGTEVNGAKRWLKIGVLFQPSELVKLGMVFSFAAMMAAWQSRMDTFKYGVLPYVTILGVIAGLLILEKHLSATMIIFVIGAVMMLLGGTKKRWLVLGALLGLAFLLIYTSKRGYAGGRITAWQNPESEPQGSGYQIIQSKYAIGSGGFLGLGLGRSRQKYLYLPEEINDYIFAIVCEELGFVGAVGILVLFSLLILRGYWIALHARDRFGTILAAGLTTKLAIQVFLNVSVVTGLTPPTGISLPFFSSGGTALLLQLFEMGIILSISRWCTNKEVTGRSHA